MERPAVIADAPTETFVPRETAVMTETVLRKVHSALEHRFLVLPDGGRGRIVSKRARGGFGEVWTVEHPSGDARYVAKLPRVFPDDGRTRSATESILQEGRILARLRVAGVPQLLGQGLWEGRPYLLLPYIEGETWRRILNRGFRCDERQWISCTADLARILDHVHRQGVVHRDIKPANILFGRTAKRRKPQTMLIDFGLASGTEDARQEYRAVTLGTRGYLDPRMIGRAEHHDSAADVYALGVMLFEGYTWQALFSKDEWGSVIATMRPEPGDTGRVETVHRFVERKCAGFERLPVRIPELETLIADILRPGTEASPRLTAGDVAQRLTDIASFTPSPVHGRHQRTEI